MWIRLLFWYCALLASAQALTIQVDYRYDTNNFFSAAGNPGGATGAAQARAALEAAADRWGAIIDEPLGAVSVGDDSDDARIGFDHPGTGASYQVSAASGTATDAIVIFGEPTDAADEYRGAWSIPVDTWILYAGGRNISSDGIGGTGTGLNFNSVFDDPNGIHNRGFNVGFGTLPVWGGSISFNTSNANNWHFDHTTAAGSEGLDFYSVALHEIGHALGLGTNWDEWSGHVSAGYFSGPNAIAAYNADNGSLLTRLLLQTGGGHWDDGGYDSVIFPAGNPIYVGTVGARNLQDLLMEPRADFSYPALRRFEVTSVDVGALQDLGWSTISAGAQPTLTITSVTRNTTGAVTLAWLSEVGASYTVQTSLDMQTWSNVTPAITSAGSSTSWTDGSAGFTDPTPPSTVSLAKYYRVRKN